MASMELGTFGMDLEWYWGSLRPWQILHSRLAEHETRGKMLDVWELIDETMDATATDLRHKKEEEEAKEERGRGSLWALDDGEFWRHGGVMEARIRDWLERKEEEGGGGGGGEVMVKKCSSSDETGSGRGRAWAVTVEEESYEGEYEVYEYIDGEDGQEEEEEEEEEGEREEGEAEFVVERSVVLYERRYCRDSWNARDDDDEEEQGGGFATANHGGRRRVSLPGTAKTAAPALPLAADLEEEVCPVCLETLPGAQLLALPCSHAFHAACLSPWLQRPSPHAGPAPRCPCCRAPVPLHLAESLDLATSSYKRHHYRYYDDYYDDGDDDDDDDDYGFDHAADDDDVERAISINLSRSNSNTSTSSNNSTNSTTSSNPDIMCLLADMEAALEHFGFRS